MPNPQRNSEALREELNAVEAWMASGAFIKWQEARDREAAVFNEQLAYDAETAEDIVRIRALRVNTLSIKESFEELRETLKTALDEAVEAETQLALDSKN